MINFRTFLEASVVPLSLTVENYNEQNINFIKKKCSAALELLKENYSLWRGDNLVTIGNNKIGFVDTSKSERKSQNTPNWYTIIFDNDPDYRAFPKRSKSLICTNTYYKALGFGKKEHTFAILPFDNANIGCTLTDDMWKTRVNMSSLISKIIDANDQVFPLLVDYGLRDNWDSFKTFSDNLTEDNKARIHKQLKKLFFSDENIDRLTSNFLKYIIETYSPKVTNFKHGKISKMIGLIKSEEPYEFWVEGDVVLINKATFKELKNA